MKIHVFPPSGRVAGSVALKKRRRLTEPAF